VELCGDRLEARLVALGRELLAEVIEQLDEERRLELRLEPGLEVRDEVLDLGVMQVVVGRRRQVGELEQRVEPGGLRVRGQAGGQWGGGSPSRRCARARRGSTASWAPTSGRVTSGWRRATTRSTATRRSRSRSPRSCGTGSSPTSTYHLPTSW